MKTPLFLTCSMVALALPCLADTFILKDGSRLEGQVLSETDDSYVLEIQVTKSIKDERTVAKTDVEKVEKSQPDLTAFETIQKLVPTPDGLTDDEYDQRILQVTDFQKKFPDSSIQQKAAEILEALKKEALVVAAGGAKVDGRILSAEEYAANAYELDAKVLELRIRERIEDSDVLGALRLFSGFQSDFKPTLNYQNLLPVMRQALTTYERQLAASAASFDDRLKERQIGLERMKAEDRGNSERAIQEEARVLEARYQEEKQRDGWVTPHLFHKQSLEDTRQAVAGVLAEVSAAAPPVDGGKLYRDAWSAAQSAGASTESGAPASSGATEAIAAAKQAQIPARYIEKLESAAK